jgi:hypothetical protein
MAQALIPASSLPILECHSDAHGNVIGLEIGAAEFTIVVGVDGKALVQ